MYGLAMLSTPATADQESFHDRSTHKKVCMIKCAGTGGKAIASIVVIIVFHTKWPDLEI